MHHDSSIEIGAISEKGKIIPVLLAPIIAIAFYFILPETYTSASGAVVPFTHAARACGAVVLLMAIWWFTEAIPIAVTALLPIVLSSLWHYDTCRSVEKLFQQHDLPFLGRLLDRCRHRPLGLG